MDSINETYVFSDNLVATIAKLVQVGILTGTDIYDHLRTIQCVCKDGQLHTSPAFAEKIQEEISSMLERAQDLQSEK